ncbi:MAG: hypothetical protein K2J40_07095 [Ruminococcus sp.]|nr:hypothetical protein [Ruminococcus sp.]
MNKKSREALKNAFNIPEPDRKELFFDNLDVKPKKKLPAHIPMYISAAAAAVMVIGVWGNIKNLPDIDQPEVIDKPVYSKTLTENYTENIIQTTTASSAKKTVVQTTGVTGTATTVNTATTKENNKPPEISDTESPETETYENNADEEIITTSEIKHTAVTETTARNTTVTTTARHTTTTARHTTVTTTAATTARRTTSATYPVTTTDDELGVNIATTTYYENDLPPVQIVPEPSGGSIPPDTTQPPVSAEEPADYTVQPPVCYSPSADAVRIESNGSDYNPKPTDSPQLDNWYDLKKLSENSDLIVIATTYEVIYTGLNGIPYTQENISVSDVLYGDIPNNSAISVYGIGGYIPADEFSEMHIQWAVEQNRTLFVAYGNKTTPEVGDTRIYFLKKSSGNFPDGSYVLTSLNDMSKFRYNGDYINLNDESITFTLSELYEYLNN